LATWHHPVEFVR
jgi:hypothetical protein